MKALVRAYPFPSAGNAIYMGYANAFRGLGYDVSLWDERHLDDLPRIKGDILMCTDHDIRMLDISGALDDTIKSTQKIVCFVSANWMPTKFNIRSYYCTCLLDDLIEKLNNEKKVLFWSFGEERDRFGHNFMNKFNRVISLPLAFDNYDYQLVHNVDWKYDVCFVGAYVNNGVAFKAQHIKDWIMSLEDTKLKCGFFGMDGKKKISVQEESMLMFNSKICLNVNDEYQLLTGMDVNEREFKSLGVNGFLVSDNVWQSEKLGLPSIRCNNKKEYHDNIFKYMDTDLRGIKEKNREFILSNHTYTHRVKKIEEFL